MRLTLATLASGAPMGQQAYEDAVASRAQDALGPDWQVRSTVVRTLRSPLPGTARVPAAVLSSRSAATRRAAGALLYARAGLLHRMDLRLPPGPATEILTVHDAVAWRFPDEGAPPGTAAREAARAAAVVCPSAFAADEVSMTLGVADPVVIHNGVEARFFDPAPLTDAQLAELGVPGPFVLHAGGCSHRKNLPALAAAWKIVQQNRPSLTLAMLGPKDVRRDALFADLANTKLMGRLPAEVVPGLMARATAIVVPSLYEGFGLPAIEAMAAGVPVVASARSSLPEVCGDAAILVEPTADGLAGGLIAAADGGAEIAGLVERGRLRAADFSWDANLAAHAKLWRQFG